MTFTESIKTCFKKFITFKGRASRSEFWWFYLFGVILFGGINILLKFGGINILFFLIKTHNTTLESYVYVKFVLFLYFFIYFAYSLALVSASVRRLHDTNRSGWWLLLWGLIIVIFGITAEKQLLSIILSIVLIILIVWLCQDGDYDANKYGERNE